MSEDDATRFLRRALGAVAGRNRTRRCGARTRAGAPCKMQHASPWANRCRLHGGLSTGPRTAEGRARIARAQRDRWARWRAAQGRPAAAEHGEGE